MGWKFWKREQTEAELSLAALQEATATPPPPAPAVVAPPADPPPNPLLVEADAHLGTVWRDLELIVGGSDDDPTRFMLEVTAVRADDGGTVVLTGGAHEGVVEPGATVGLLVLPHGMATTHPDLPTEEGERQQAEALLGARAVRATVVAWRPELLGLELSGIGPDDVSVGSMAVG